MLSKNCTLVVLVLLYHVPVTAHDVWIMPTEGDKTYRMVFGHTDQLEKYDPMNVRELVAIDIGGKFQNILSQVKSDEIGIKIKDDTALIAISYDNGYSTEGPGRKYFSGPKWKVPDYKFSIHTVMFNKNILKWGPAVASPLGLGFEIVPLVNPLKLAPGESLPIKVLYKTKPLVNADVEILGDKNVYTTDTMGQTKVPIQSSNFQYILATHVESTKSDPNADEQELSANLIFMLPERNTKSVVKGAQ
jgi:uncharacterized GH25 family protein